MMCIVIDVDHLFAFYDKFKSALHAGKRLQCLFYGWKIHATMFRSNRSCHCVFNVMKTGDTEPNVLDLTKSMKVEFKKSAFGGNVAGKKLSPAHAVNIFSNVINVIGKQLYD